MDRTFISSMDRFRLSGITCPPSRKVLGQGAYGLVEEYTYRELRCAGKKLMPILREATSKNEEQAQLKKAVKECEVLSELKHPNIVQFLGVHFEKDDPVPILIMEYVPYTLSGFLDRHKHGGIPLEITYGILVDVAQALCYLHGGDPVIIHRDLSANNVLLTTDLRAKLSDLGTARILDVSVYEKINRYQKMSTCPGTLAYMPPEARLEKALYNENIDCYSYGVLILHVLNRDWPILHVDEIVPVENQVIIMTDIERRQQHIDKIDDSHPLKGLILRCLEHKEKRPTAKEILEKVQAVQKQCCTAKSDRMTLLIQQRSDSDKKAALEREIGELKSEMERRVGQLNNEIKTNKYLHSEEAKKMAAEMEKLKGVNEGLKSMVDIKTIDLEALKEHEKSVIEELRKKEEEINDAETKLRTYQVEKDGEIEEILRKKREEIDAIKKDAEEKLHSYQEKKDEEIANIKRDAEEKQVAYKKQLNDKVAEKEKEMNAYSEKLRKKEEILEAAIRREAQKAYEALHKSRSEQGTVLEYLRSGTQMHPLHHRVQRLKWRQGPSLPVGMTAPQCVLIKSSLYVGGGQTVVKVKESKDLIFVYDSLESDGFWKSPFSPSPTVFFGLGELDEKLVIVGGEKEAEDKQLSITGDVFVLEKGGTGWTSDVIPPLKKPRVRSCVISYKGCIAACGGLEEGAPNVRICSSAVEVYRSEGREWCTVASLPVPRAALRVAIIHKTAYFLGGFYPDLSGPGKPNCMSVELEDLFQDDLKSQIKWNDKFQDCPFECCTPASLCGSLIAVGGVDQTGTRTEAICAYSPTMNKWHKIDELPIKLSTATAVTLTSGEIVVLGGKLRTGLNSKDRNKDVYIGSLE